jgi:hypothetical protein
MHKLRIVGIGAAITSALCAIAAICAHHYELPLARAYLVVTAAGAGFSVMPIYCTTVAVRALRGAREEVHDIVTAETRALHRAMVVTMEQYGDRRAVDAVIAAERRHALNERGVETTDLQYVGRVNTGNVTPIRKP